MINKIDKNGIDLLVQVEGLELEPYPDSKKVPTIGIGSTYYENGQPVKLTDKALTKEECYHLFELTKSKYEKPINDSIKVPITQSKFNALFLFCYNIGAAGFKNSTVVRLINAGAARKDIETAFMMWRGKTKNKAGKYVLESRRQFEINEYFKQ